MKPLALVVFTSATAACIALAPPTATAQGLREVPQNFRAILGGDGTVLRPVGEFERYVQWGGGGDFFAVLNPSRATPLGLRLDGAVMLYGYENFAVPTTPLLPRVTLQGTTSNIIVSAGVGPQLTFGHGWLRPYGYGTVGFAYFATTSELRGISGGDGFGNTTNFDDWTSAFTLGGGVLIQLSSRRHPALLDLGLQSLYSGPTQYLRKSSLTDLPDGSVAFVPIRSRTDMVQFRIGLAVGLP
jgi:hypothetical protein